jgi:hypothetical protein
MKEETELLWAEVRVESGEKSHPSPCLFLAKTLLIAFLTSPNLYYSTQK